MRALEHRIPPPLVGLACAFAMWFVAPLGPQLPLADGWRHGIAGVLVVVGLAFDLLGLLAFRAARTTVNPLVPERASALVTTGVYRFTRNPMYVGMACLLLGGAVWLGSLLPFGGPLLFIACITRFQIRPEERAMQARFGASFDQYTARVRRWL